MNDNRGFTLVELLACLVILGMVFAVGFYVLKGTYSTSMTQLDEISENEIYNAARDYVMETNKSFNNGYACVTIKELIDYGYLKNDINTDKIVRVTKNMQTKVIEKFELVDNCNN